ncbi:glyoxalase [Planobispora rosea]|uniref:Glyoxalase n=1 Tax=Planobispora rosea TaxID=35762 RepID=A0A8J3RX90_PLARO|nr:VOC family protein [Planobispora rosea]GGS56832.1 glyoxalase [Planobispora rosea]GIH83497.1 glyoxalase [Planobispora rosea]
MSERSGYRPGVPCWVELASPDAAASARFYRELFGWDAVFDEEPRQGGYGRFTLRGRFVAGLEPRFGRGVQAMWHTYVAVDDAAAAADRVRAAGGTVVAEPVKIMERGVLAAFHDPSGAFFAVWQAGEDHGAQLAGEPGTFGWTELSARDTAVAKTFYARVFGWGAEDTGTGGVEYVEWQAHGRRVAGMAPMGPNVPPEVPSHWRTYFVVEDADATVARVRQLGGKVFSEPVNTHAGPVAVVADPQFAPFAVIALRESG